MSFQGMRTTNWTSLTNSRPRKGSRNRLDRGEYEWTIVLFDKNDKRKSDRTIWADDFDEAVRKALRLVEYGERVTVDGRSFVK